MLQDCYEKHNLEMKPYQYYLAEFQNVNPEEVTSRLDIPFDDNSNVVAAVDAPLVVAVGDLAEHIHHQLSRVRNSLHR